MYGKISSFKRVVSTCSVNYSKKGVSKKLLEFLADMPRDNSFRIMKTQQQRANTAKKFEMYSSSSIYLQVLGSGARGAPNTLYIFTDQKRYLFNCGEGTQRLAHEHKVRLSKLEHIFITSKTWRNIGGLPGVSLTLQDVGVPNITLHGPEGLDELYTATRRFVIMKDMNVKMAKCSPSEDFEDNVMNVKYVLLGPDDNLLENDLRPAAKRAKINEDNDKAFEEFINDDTDYYNKSNIQSEPNKSKTAKPKSRSPEKDPMTRNEKVLKDLQKKTNCTVAYICTFKKRLGSLDLQKCVERGVKPGPLLGKLKNGEDVVLPDGTLVLSKDVKTPDDPGPVIIVLEVPHISYLKESEFSAHFDNGINPPENVPTVVIHYTPPDVFHDPTYRAFMRMFGGARHLALNSQNSCLGSEAVHRTQHRLHLLDADVFPLLRDTSVPAAWRATPHRPADETRPGLEELKNKIALAQFQNIVNMDGCCKGDAGVAEDDAGVKLDVIAARTLTIFHLRPKRELDRSAEPKLQIQEYIQEAMDVDGFAASLEQFRKLVDSIRYAKNGSQKEYPKVVFLGTGSCIPAKTRNTSAIVLQMDENHSMLLDCGEGTFGQLVRFYGPKRVNAFLRTLKAIYISHLHADHHIGLIGVLQGRREAFDEISSMEPAADALQLLAPGQIVSWLATYDMQFEKIRGDFTLIPNQDLLKDASRQEVSSAMFASLGVQGITTCYVSHCPNAFGVAIYLDGQHKITYSGDTIPCDQLVEIGQNSTLLIHEATMEDELAEEARMKMHSTTSQAIEIGQRMGAQYTMLTHFSQRYARLPRLSPRILNDNTSVGIAFDNMQVTMSDLALLPHMYAPLQLMFAEHCVELELKAAQRAQRARRLAEAADFAPAPDNNRRKKPDKCQILNTTESTPAPPTQAVTAVPMYRDSNASRLRHEIRRMVAGEPIRRGARSKSCSSTKSARSTTPKSPNSANASPERSTDVISSRLACDSTVSDRGAIDKSKRSYGHVIDSRSRTLNSASAAPSTDKLPDSKTNRKKNEPSVASFKESSGGYGKPLVTSLNKKPVIRRANNSGPSNTDRDISWPIVANVNRSKSPNNAVKAENRSSSSFNTSAHDRSRANAAPETVKRPRCCPPAKSPTSFVPPTLQRFNTSPRRENSVERRPQDSRSLTRANNVGQERNVKSWNSDLRAPIRNPTRTQTPTGGRRYSKEVNTRYPMKPSDRSKDTMIGKQVKQTFSKNGNKSKITNQNNFKPQLEDIKSSYLLLNKNVNDNVHEPVDNNDNLSMCEPFLNDNDRRVQLLEIKQRYKSKQFWNDSKYDKIEGLNWITWK